MTSTGITRLSFSTHLVAVATSAALLLSPNSVNSTSGPDLIPADITFDNATLKVGRRIHFDSGVRNVGNQGTPVFNVKWFINGKEVGAYGSHSGISAKTTVLNGNSQFDWTFTKPGTYTITFKVDVDDHVAETNENNNSRSVVIKVAGASSMPQQQKCSKITFIGMRGSGEKAYESENKMGWTVFRGVFEQFIQHANHADVPVEPVGFDEEEYPAVPVLSDLPHHPSLAAGAFWRKGFPSVSKGVVGLAAHMKDAVRDPKNCIALAGYSQGAWVITTYLGLHPEYKQRISAVVLFGDPLFLPDSPVSQGSRAAKGIIRNHPFGSQAPQDYYNDMQDRVRSYCEKGDFVCNETVKNWTDCGFGANLLCPHYSYIAGVLPHGYTEDGTAFLVKRLLGPIAMTY